jgi:hypothetical protein
LFYSAAAPSRNPSELGFPSSLVKVLLLSLI